METLTTLRWLRIFVPSDQNGERRKAMETVIQNFDLENRSGGDQNGERRKAMETSFPLLVLPIHRVGV